MSDLPELRLAKREERAAVYAMYRSVCGSPFCVWDDEYPSWEEIDRDGDANGLYVLCEDGRPIGALSIPEEQELGGFDGWQEQNAVEIARVVVDPAHQGNGYAVYMLRAAEALLRERGCGAIHLAVAPDHPPAHKTYDRTGFAVRGMAELYGAQYEMREKILR